MLSRFSDVLQSAADVLAPPATRLEDFEYHWKMILNFYQNYDDNSKFHVEDTKVPHHLHQMLQLIVDEEKDQQGGTVGPCLEAVVQRSICLLDALQALAAADRPPGARALALGVATALLRRTVQPCLNSAHVYRPLQRMLIQCNESPASPTEKEEVELLLTLCGLVRKEPGLANIFTTPFVEDKTNTSLPEDIKKLIPMKYQVQTPKKNPLFEVEMIPNPLRHISIVRSREDARTNSSSSMADEKDSCKSQKTLYDDNDKFLLIDLLLSYLNSADNQVVLRACEGVMIVSSLPEDDIANLVTSCSPVCETIIDKLAAKYRHIPQDVDPNDVDHLNITWAYVAQDFGDKGYSKFHGYRELTSFFSWLDYCDTLMKECHPTIAAHLARTFRAHFLEGVAEAALMGADEYQDIRLREGEDTPHATPGRAALAAALLAKCLRAIDSSDLINEFSNWLVGDGEVSEWPLLLALINNCLTNDYDLTLETLRFFESILQKGSEHSLQRLVLSRVCARAYRCVRPCAPDERERLNDLPLWRERERNREAMRQLQHEEQVSEQIHGILRHEGLQPAAARDGDAALHRVINSYLLLLPRAVLSDPVGADYEQYIHDAQRHYQLWLDITSSYNWPVEHGWIDTSSSTHSCDSRPEADIHLDDVFDTVHEPIRKTSRNELEHNRRNEKIDDRNRCESNVPNTNNTDINRYESVNTDNKDQCCEETDNDHHNDCPFSQRLVLRSRDLTSNYEEEFDEGPFFRMIFKLLANMPNQPYQVNLHLTSIISKLALMPHPNLHEYLLNPSLPTAKKTQTLFKVLQEVARKLTMEIPRLKNYKQIIETTRMQLMSEDPSYDESGHHNQLVESLIVLEEFCKELAAIAFVKYQHAVLMQR